MDTPYTYTEAEKELSRALDRADRLRMRPRSARVWRAVAWHAPLDTDAIKHAYEPALRESSAR